MTFEALTDRLDAIVAQLQRDDVPLDQALVLFEEGVQKVAAAAKELERAEARVKQLVERPDGTFDVADLRN
jgi:exodeoxyribonuclease VII small subunit